MTDSQFFTEHGDVELMLEVAQTAGLDHGKLSPENPIGKSGKVADLLEITARKIDPGRAALPVTL